MRKRLIAALAIPLLAGVTQDLPPGVLLLSRIKAHMADKFKRLPDYTCLETVQRFHKPANGRGGLKPLDTVRLEILYSQHHDLYASPGDRQFHAIDASNLIGSGMIGTGFLTLELENILLGRDSLLTYRGEEELGGRRTARYDYRLSSLSSGFTISVVGGKGVVGLEGSFWADPETLEVLRRESRATDFPVFLPVDQATSWVDYKPVRIGDRDELLPQSAEMFLRLSSGEENRDFFEFTHCGSFRAESAIYFENEGIRPAGSGNNPARIPVVPAGEEAAVPALLAVTVQLSTELTEKDGVGTRIEGRAGADVRYKGKVIIPKGAVVRGRVRRLERSFDQDGYFIVALEFTEIEGNGGTMRFYADLLKFERTPGIEAVLSHPRMVNGIGATEKITLPDLPGVASFFVRGKTLRVPPGFQTEWRTRGYLR